MSYKKKGGRVSPGYIRYGEMNPRSELDQFLVRYGF